MDSRRRYATAIALSLILGVQGCAILSPADPRVIERWQHVWAPRQPHELPPVLPVIFIPGIKGSVLKRGNKVLWGNTRVVRLSSLDDLTVPLPKQDVLPQERFDQRDSQGRRIVSTEILGDFDVRLFFPFRVTVEVPIYQRFRDILVKAAKFSPGSTVFFFDYDWRLDNRVAAVALAGALPDLRAKYNESYLRDYCAPHGSIDQCLERVRANPDWKHLVGPNGIKFNIVTHSMGGLVARYLIRGLGYGDEVHNLILVSAPNQGAMDAMRGVVVGEYPLPSVLFHFYQPKDTRPVFLSFPASFQLLPRYLGAIHPIYSDGPSQETLWLTEIPRDTPARVDETLALWLRALDYNSEDWKLLCRASRAATPEECRGRFSDHIAAELESAFHFHKTIRHGYGRLAPQAQGYEERKTAEAEAVANRLRGTSVRGTLRRDGRQEDPTHTHQFFGHCDRTATSAWAEPERIDFCGSGGRPAEACNEFGDARVPRLSFEDMSLRRDFIGQKPRGHVSDLVLCVGHTGVIDSPTVQDNLLRALFRERLDALYGQPR